MSTPAGSLRARADSIAQSEVVHCHDCVDGTHVASHTRTAVYCGRSDRLLTTRGVTAIVLRAVSHSTTAADCIDASTGAAVSDNVSGTARVAAMAVAHVMTNRLEHERHTTTGTWAGFWAGFSVGIWVGISTDMLLTSWIDAAAVVRWDRTAVVDIVSGRVQGPVKCD